MTQYQYFIPCSGGMDMHEHNVYCGCEMHGLGTEVFPKRIKLINVNTVLDLDTNIVLIKLACETLKEEFEHVSCCGYCDGDIIKTHVQYKTALGSEKWFSPAYGECSKCGGI